MCGGVRYQLIEPFARAGFCHCSRCRKVTGHPSSFNGVLPRSGLQILAGQDLLAVYAAPGDAKSAVFCRVCGSSLFRAEWPDGPWVGVRLGTLDDDPGVVAEYHIFVDDDAAWDLLPDDGLPRYSGRPTAA